MLGIKYNIVELKPHNSKWKTLFKQEKDKIMSLSIHEYIVEVEHIGSTAVAGLTAKPIIDIMLGVKNYSDSKRCIGDLENIGYRNFGECGRPGRLFFIKSESLKSTHHLHLVEYNSIYWENNIFFRDYLRNNKKIADEYAALKKDLAKKYRNDRDAYRFYKSSFVENILKKKNSLL